jgi:fatty-acid peroxygenase
VRVACIAIVRRVAAQGKIRGIDLACTGTPLPRRRTMSETPRLRGDQALSLLREGYEYIGARARRLHTDAFEARVLGKRVTFLSGRDAAELFYDESRFCRSGAVPALVQRTLFGVGGVQSLDDAAHRQRKAMFLAIMTRDNIERFLELADGEWNAAIVRWQREPRIVLLEQAQLTLFRAAAAWVGVPLSKRRSVRLARCMAAMVNGFATVGPRLWRGLLARRAAERWARSVIRRVRSGRLLPPPGAAARVFAEHHDADGKRLSAQIAGVELLNVARPITALAFWVSFMALALRDYPQYRERLASDDELLEPFVHELRRFYPFTPLLGARVRAGFEWRGVQFRKGRLALLDIYGTLRDPRSWRSPDEFRPERFRERRPSPFEFLPQGGGDFLMGHRCAGEWLSIAALKQALVVVARRLSYQLPAQDLSYRLSRVPCAPASGVVLERVSACSDRSEGRVKVAQIIISGPPSSRTAASLRAGESRPLQ